MQIIDFDKQFEKYLRGRLADDLAGSKPEEIEEMLPELYESWQNANLDELGMSPRAYFQQLKDNGTLGDYINECINQNAEITEILIDYIDDKATNTLISVLDNPKYTAQAIAFLKEIGSDKADDKLIELLSTSEDESVIELACELLSDNHSAVPDKLLKLMPNADETVQERFIDILYRYGGREEILDWLVRFLNAGKDCMLYASYIGAYGMEEAVDELINYLRQNETEKYEYLELRNAIERLGGEVPEELVKE